MISVFPTNYFDSITYHNIGKNLRNHRANILYIKEQDKIVLVHSKIHLHTMAGEPFRMAIVEGKITTDPTRST